MRHCSQQADLKLMNPETQDIHDGIVDFSPTSVCMCAHTYTHTLTCTHTCTPQVKLYT
jgi:hypothetical protein